MRASFTRRAVLHTSMGAIGKRKRLSIDTEPSIIRSKIILWPIDSLPYHIFSAGCHRYTDRNRSMWWTRESSSYLSVHRFGICPHSVASIREGHSNQSPQRGRATSSEQRIPVGIPEPSSLHVPSIGARSTIGWKEVVAPTKNCRPQGNRRPQKICRPRLQPSKP